MRKTRVFVDLMRHGNAAAPEGMRDTPLDIYRPLSELGIQQALAARSRYNGQAEKIVAVVHSPAPRALCTAAIAIGDARPQFVQLNSLWIQRDEVENDGEVLWAAFENYGYDLEKYHADPDNFGVLAALHRQAIRVIEELNTAETPERGKAGEIEDGEILLIAGHAIFSNFIAYHMTEREDEELLHIPLEEAGRIRLVFTGPTDPDLGGEYVGFER